MIVIDLHKERVWLRQHVSVKENGCWEWTLYRDRDGYGRMNRKGFHIAHRYAYHLFGPIEEAMTVDHVCWSPSCCNPAHLRLLPHIENASRQRSALKHFCVHGHEFTAANTRLRRGTRQRACIACERERQRA